MRHDLERTLNLADMRFVRIEDVTISVLDPVSRHARFFRKITPTWQDKRDTRIGPLSDLPACAIEPIDVEVVHSQGDHRKRGSSIGLGGRKLPNGAVFIQ